MARTKEYTLTGFAASANGIAAAQAQVAGTALTLEAAAASLSPARELVFDASADDIGATVFTIVGKDRHGNPITETVTGVTSSVNPVTKNAFSVVTSITPSATDADTNVTVGWPARTTSPWVACGRRFGTEQMPTALVSFIVVTGAADGVVEVSYDSNFSPAHGQYPHIFGGDQKGQGLPVDESIAVTPGTPVEAQGVFCRAVLTTGADTSAKVRFAVPGP
jgi:hypothetical protein